MADTALLKTSANTLNPADSNSSKNPIKSPNPLASIMFFFIVTTVYCGFNMFISSDFTRMILKICYILFVIIGEFFINLSLSESMCGLRQWSNALFITVIPWLLIFGVLHFFLIIFPGWMSPFSNTFGYLVVKLMGFPEFLETLLNNEASLPTNTPNAPNASSAINILKTDHSMLINEMFIESVVEKNETTNGQQTVTFTRPVYEGVLKTLTESGIFKLDTDLKKATIQKDKLYKFVIMKHSISEYVWNLLAGFLVTSVTYNQIINSSCKNSSKEMKDRYDAYEAGEAKRIEDNRKLELINNTNNTNNTTH